MALWDLITSRTGPEPSQPNMPSELAIRAYWMRTNLMQRQGFTSEEEFLSKVSCFACGPCTREHPAKPCLILPQYEGGDSTVQNLHMLCWKCQEDSKHLSGEKYWRWLYSRDLHVVFTTMYYQQGYTTFAQMMYLIRARQDIIAKRAPFIEAWLETPPYYGEPDPDYASMKIPR
jgi:hypothetical protein